MIAKKIKLNWNYYEFLSQKLPRTHYQYLEFAITTLLRRILPHFSTKNWGYVSWPYQYHDDTITKVGDLGLVSM